MNVLAAFAIVAATLQGTTTFEQEALPGCSVTVESSAAKRSAVTDAEGAYRIESLEPGEYTLKIELPGLDSLERTIHVADGDNVEDAELRIAPVLSLMSDCRPCSKETPATVWDLPTCADYELDRTLLENIRRGDGSAAALAVRHYAAASTYAQKLRLAAALLRRVPDDSPYWSELYEHARNRVELGTKLEAWCEAREIPHRDYRWMSELALGYVADDARSRPLLLKALESDDAELLRPAIQGLMEQHDTMSLPAIAKVLERHPAVAASSAREFFWWRSAAADEIAFRYLDEEEREEYRRLQRELP
jgi:hypothetical protein